MSKYIDGIEHPSSDRVEIPLEYKRPPSIHELIAQAIRTDKIRTRIAQSGFESPEEADDFDVDDDAELPHTDYELTQEQEDRLYESELRGNPQAPEPGDSQITPASGAPGPAPGPAPAPPTGAGAQGSQQAQSSPPAS